MLSHLFNIPDASCPVMDFHNGLQGILRHDAFFLQKADSPKNLGKGKVGENDFFLFLCVIRQLNHRKTGQYGGTNLILIIGGCDWVHTGGWNHAFHIVIRKAQIVQQCQKDIGGIAVSFSGGCLIQLVDNENQIGFPCPGEGLHDDTGFRIGVYSGASRKLLRVINGAHIQSGPGKL